MILIDDTSSPPVWGRKGRWAWCSQPARARSLVWLYRNKGWGKIRHMPTSKLLSEPTAAAKQPNDGKAQDASGLMPAPVLKNGKLLTDVRRIADAASAMSIAKAFDQGNAIRAGKLTAVQLQYDGQPPQSLTTKTALGEANRPNFSTGWLAGIIDRVVMRYVGQAVSAKYVTNAAYPDFVEDSVIKTDIVRSAISKGVRSWKGWRDFISQLSQETVLHGYCYAYFLDGYEWKPKFIKQTNGFTEEKVGLISEEYDCVLVRHDYYLHKFIDMFKDEEAAELAGFNLENCKESASKASVKAVLDDNQVSNPRSFAEMIRDGSLSLAYGGNSGGAGDAGGAASGTASGATGGRIVPVYFLYYKEYDGEVSCYMLDRNSGKPLAFFDKRYESMDEVLTVFTLGPGDGNLGGVKGVGRMLYNQSVNVEYARNKMFESLVMSGLLVLRVPTKDAGKMQASVVGNFCVVDKEVEVATQTFPANAQGWFSMDNSLTNMAEQSAGANISQTTPEGKTDKTATEASIDARREYEVASSLLDRFTAQLSELVTQMQRRMFCDENLDEAEELMKKRKDGMKLPEFYKILAKTDCAVVAAYTCLEKGITREELELFRELPSDALVQQDDANKKEGVLKLWEVFKGDPAFDQQKLKRRVAEALAGEDEADDLLIPVGGAQEETVSVQKQMDELATMKTLGLLVPVAPSDRHDIHLTVLAQAIPAMLEAVQGEAAENPTGDLQSEHLLALVMQHMQSHLEQWQLANATPEMLKPFTDVLNGVVKEMAHIGKAKAQLAAQAQQEAAQALAQQQAEAQKQAAAAKVTSTDTPESVTVVPPAGEGEPVAAGAPGTPEAKQVERMIA